ncbi:zinc-ribbon domain-containing protein [Limosilactobacillus balticus]
MKKCPYCNTLNPDDAEVCENCGVVNALGSQECSVCHTELS